MPNIIFPKESKINSEKADKAFELYLKGDTEKALNIYCELASVGSARAAFAAALIYAQRFMSIYSDCNFEEAEKAKIIERSHFYRESALKSKHPFAFGWTADIEFDCERNDSALKYLREGMKLNDPCSILYSVDKNTENYSYTKALKVLGDLTNNSEKLLASNTAETKELVKMQTYPLCGTRFCLCMANILKMSILAELNDKRHKEDYINSFYLALRYSDRPTAKLTALLSYAADSMHDRLGMHSLNKVNELMEDALDCLTEMSPLDAEGAKEQYDETYKLYQSFLEYEEDRQIRRDEQLAYLRGVSAAVSSKDFSASDVFDRINYRLSEWANSPSTGTRVTQITSLTVNGRDMPVDENGKIADSHYEFNDWHIDSNDKVYDEHNNCVGFMLNGIFNGY